MKTEHWWRQQAVAGVEWIWTRQSRPKIFSTQSCNWKCQGRDQVSQGRDHTDMWETRWVHRGQLQQEIKTLKESEAKRHLGDPTPQVQDCSSPRWTCYADLLNSGLSHHPRCRTGKSHNGLPHSPSHSSFSPRLHHVSCGTGKLHYLWNRMYLWFKCFGIQAHLNSVLSIWS